MRPARSLVLLDRDGVINADSDRYIKSVAEWHPLPGSLEAIVALARAGIDVVVVTNQSGVGRGLLTEATLEAIHAHMRAAVEALGGRLAGVYYCPHRPDEGCSCRKPRTGLLERVAADFEVGLEGVPFVGDKQIDVDTARAVGARPILVRTGLEPPPRAAADVETYSDLAEVAAQLLAEAEA